MKAVLLSSFHKEKKRLQEELVKLTLAARDANELELRSAWFLTSGC